MRILIPGSKLNSQEQLEMAKYLVKAGYAVSITKGKSQNGKAVSYINYNIVEVQDEQTQKRDKPCGSSLGINKYKIGVSKSGVIVSRPKNNRIYDWKYVWEIDSDKKGAKL